MVPLFPSQKSEELSYSQSEESGDAILGCPSLFGKPWSSSMSLSLGIQDHVTARRKFYSVTMQERKKKSS